MINVNYHFDTYAKKVIGAIIKLSATLYSTVIPTLSSDCHIIPLEVGSAMLKEKYFLVTSLFQRRWLAAPEESRRKTLGGGLSAERRESRARPALLY